MTVCPRRHASHLAQLIEIRARVEKGDELPATQHELVERVLCALADAARMDHQQHLDVVVDSSGVQADALHRVVAPQLADEHLRLHRLAAGELAGGMPNTGSALITPITGFAVAAARAIARTRSYSSNGSRSSASAGKASFWSA